MEPIVTYCLWKVVHRLHSASWWMLLRVRPGEEVRQPGDLWKSASLEGEIESAGELPAPLSTGCYRSRRKLFEDLQACGVRYQIVQPR